MSHLIATPFNKQSTSNGARSFQPPSPPDTEMDYRLQASTSRRSPPKEITALPDSNVFQDRLESNSSSSIQAPETPGMQSRRTSNLAYRNTGLSTETRLSRRPGTKWLVVVIPPSSFSREHGNLGHTLSSSPPGRLSHGVLMPLFPSMYGQLTAIAREFSFPSTTGICIYLQVAEGALNLSPRVSDESWPLLWGSFFEDRTPSGQSHGLPIAGRIEFDLDLYRARWYDAWIASYRREFDVIASSASSRTVSMSHGRIDSRATIAQEFLDDQMEVPSLLQQRLSSSLRPVPKKLSLVDKLESPSVRSNSRSTRRLVQSPPSHDGKTTHTSLSPVVQEDEPETAKQELTTLVNTWRASSSVAPSPLTSSAQIALDPVNIPNTIPLPDLDENEAEGVELNLDDFSWSISSAGPPSYPELPYLSESGVASPDLGLRALEYSMLTPTTATTWGPPLSWPPSPATDFRAPSLDIGERTSGSRPLTPSTATTWGPPLSFPPSPIVLTHVTTPDIAERSFDEFQKRRVPSGNNTSRKNDSIIAAGQHGSNTMKPLVWKLVWPYINKTSSSKNTSSVWSHVWPYYRQRAEPVMVVRLDMRYPAFNLYPAVYPYFDLYPKKSLEDIVPSSIPRLKALYPFFEIYPAVYPAFELYPGNVITPQSQILLNTVGERKPLADISTGISTQLSSKYPLFNLYPSVYPYNLLEIYPSQSLMDEDLYTDVSVKYPVFNIYPAIYPHIVPYPLIDIPTELSDSNNDNTLNANEHFEGDPAWQVKLQVQYPAMNIYPAAYPYFDIYPKASLLATVQNDQTAEIAHLGDGYPYFNLYPAVYPHFNLYPKVVFDNEVSNTLSRYVEPVKAATLQSVTEYPLFNLYPAVYPFFDIYPPRSLGGNTKLPVISIQLSSKYPGFNLYPVVYPHFDLYPEVMLINAQEDSTMKEENKLVIVHLSPAYPSVNIYPVVYPYFDLYPSNLSEDNTENSAVSVILTASYPAFNIYPAVYPYFDIYPDAHKHAARGLTVLVEDVEESLNNLGGPTSLNGLNSGGSYLSPYGIIDMYSAMSPTSSTSEDFGGKLVVDKLQPQYPAFDIYPAKYPYFDIYRSGSASTPDYWREPQPVAIKSYYPYQVIYPPVYPYFDIYKSGVPSAYLNERVNQPIFLKSSYPALVIYPSVYPHLEIYPNVSISNIKSPSAYRRPPRTYSELDGIDLDESIPPVLRHAPIQRTVQASATQRSGKRPRYSHEELVDIVLGDVVPKSVLKKTKRKSHQELYEDVFGNDIAEHYQSRGQHKGLVRKVSFADDIITESSSDKRPMAPTVAPKPIAHRSSTLTDAQRELGRLMGLPSGPKDTLGQRAQSPARQILNSHDNHATRSITNSSHHHHRSTRSLDSPPWPTAFWSAPEEDIPPRQFHSVDLGNGGENRILPQMPSQGLRRARSAGHVSTKPSALRREVTQPLVRPNGSSLTSSKQLSPVEEADASKHTVKRNVLESSNVDSHSETRRILLPGNPAEGLRRSSSLTGSEKVAAAVPSEQIKTTATNDNPVPPQSKDHHMNTQHRILLPTNPSEGVRARQTETLPSSSISSPPQMPSIVTVGLEKHHKKSPSTSPSHGVGHSSSHKKRDSIVLEKARAWSQRSVELQVSQVGKELAELSSIPRSPPPPLPIVPSSNGLSRPIAKLDKSKIPFS